ncbi:FKBP62 [Symbiodinium natans]|uniref:peptidylprolyl isomerase n=1 Tax=Symbiodinium natans TaxID=878477 RepID=A0A812UTQ6_9DINO|nr:FKBP62 [Symbiodinium natans]
MPAPALSCRQPPALPSAFIGKVMEALRRKIWMCAAGVPSSHSSAEGRVHAMLKQAPAPSPWSEGWPSLRASVVPYGVQLGKEADWQQSQASLWMTDNPSRQAERANVADILPLLREEVVAALCPNADFGDSSDSEGEDPAPSAPRLFRHADHEREWTRLEFREWAEAVSEKHGYWISELGGVGHLPDLEAQGPCTQLVVFERKDVEETGMQEEECASFAGMESQVDFNEVREQSARSEELAGSGSGLWKLVLREGEGDPAPKNSRVNLHYSTYLADGRRVDTSREGKRSMPCAFQLGRQDQGVEAWHLAAETMRCGEVAWVQSPSRYAYGSRGAPPHIPAGAEVWFCLELTSVRPPCTVKFLNRAADALEEADKHMEVGRADIKRQAFAQGRQAFRRAVAAVPDKLLLRQSDELIARFAKMERASLLNQAHCCLKLGESVPESKAEAQDHFREALQAYARSPPLRA